MAEIVNLNKFRKVKARESDRQQASENRTRFGRTKVEKKNDRYAAERHEAVLTGKQLDNGEAQIKTDEPESDGK